MSIRKYLKKVVNAFLDEVDSAVVRENFTPRLAIENAVRDALARVNVSLPVNERIVWSIDAPLRGVLDSLSMVRFAIEVEANVATATGVAVCLSGDRTMSLHGGPYATVRTLVDHLVDLVENP